MEESRGSVRIGPISLFVLVMVLCLAVLAVLSLQTARAQQTTTQQQALMIEDTYANEQAGQEFLAQLDAILVQGRNGNLSYEELLSQISDFVVTQNMNEGLEAGLESDMDPSEIVDISYDAQDPIVRAVFVQESGRKLVAKIRINPDMTYTIISWLVSTQWVEPGANIVLWQG